MRTKASTTFYAQNGRAVEVSGSANFNIPKDLDDLVSYLGEDAVKAAISKALRISAQAFLRSKLYKPVLGPDGKQLEMEVDTPTGRKTVKIYEPTNITPEDLQALADDYRYKKPVERKGKVKPSDIRALLNEMSNEELEAYLTERKAALAPNDETPEVEEETSVEEEEEEEDFDEEYEDDDEY